LWFYGQVLNHLLYLMRVSERNIQRRIALALAHLCTPNDRKVIFLHKNGTTFRSAKLYGLSRSNGYIYTGQASHGLFLNASYRVRFAVGASRVWKLEAAT